MGGLVVLAAVVGLREVHALVQRIGDGDVLHRVQMVLVRDRVLDHVADLLRAGGIQIRRLLSRLGRFVRRDGDFDRVAGGGGLVVHRHRCGVVHGRGGLVLLDLPGLLVDLDRQLDGAALEGIHTVERPGHGMAFLVVLAAVVGLHEVHALVQHVGHNNICLLVEVVDIRDRVDDLVADLLRVSGVQALRLLHRLLRILGLDGDVDHVGLGFIVVADLHARRVLHGRHGLAFVQVAGSLEHLDRHPHLAIG